MRLTIIFKKLGHSRPIFSLFSSFSIQLIVNINFADYWIRTAGRPLYQLRHNHFLLINLVVILTDWFWNFQICEKVTKDGWTVVRDPENRMGPYAYKGNEWVSFDDIDTVQMKVGDTNLWHKFLLFERCKNKSNKRPYLFDFILFKRHFTGNLWT